MREPRQAFSVPEPATQAFADCRLLLAPLRGGQAGRQATIDHPVLPGDLAALVAREESGDGGDVIRLAGATGRKGAAEDLSQQFEGFVLTTLRDG